MIADTTFARLRTRVRLIGQGRVSPRLSGLGYFGSFVRTFELRAATAFFISMRRRPTLRMGYRKAGMDV